MFQSNKQYIDFLIRSGVHTFLQDTPNNLLKNNKINNKIADKIQNNKLDEIDKLSDLLTIIKNHDSPRKKTAINFALNDGNIESKLMIVGEAPGQKEDEQSKPFAGEEGKLLDKMLSAINLERKNTYITNLIPWRHPQDKKPTDDEILEFMPYLQKHIEIIKPSFMYLLGSTAVKAVLSTPLQLDRLRGKWHKYKSINMQTSIDVLVSYHPALLLKSPNYKKKAWNDLQMLQKKLNEN